jgi:hypothetical protein
MLQKYFSADEAFYILPAHGFSNCQTKEITVVDGHYVEFSLCWGLKMLIIRHVQNKNCLLRG